MEKEEGGVECSEEGNKLRWGMKNKERAVKCVKIEKDIDYKRKRRKQRN